MAAFIWVDLGEWQGKPKHEGNNEKSPSTPTQLSRYTAIAMSYLNRDLILLLRDLDLGNSVAEQDTLLESARVETSAFTDLLADRVDLIPGTKGSGKSALYRIFVDFLRDFLLDARKVVVAHGVERTGDDVFHAFTDRFGKMDESGFVNFWCVYFVSLAREHFVKGPSYQSHLKGHEKEVAAFEGCCRAAGIPEFRKQRSLRDVLAWTLDVTRRWNPKVRFKLPPTGEELELALFEFDEPRTSKPGSPEPSLPLYAARIRDALHAVLEKANLTLWLMVDRLDEIFPRRSPLEKRALRGLLRTLRIFDSSRIRAKVFLRDDILDEVTTGGSGFTALTHVTAREADTLRWSEEQILTMAINRLCENRGVALLLHVDRQRLLASYSYRLDIFYEIFPATVHRGSNQSPTHRWVYTHTSDGKGVVTPRDVIDLLTRAKQHQQDLLQADPSGESSSIIGSAALQYGLREVSKRKCRTYLKAEFPQLWKHIDKLRGGKTEYNEDALRSLFGREYLRIVEDLASIGLFAQEKKRTTGEQVHKVPFIYREGLELTQGKAF
jgi:hypothetical protein